MHIVALEPASAAALRAFADRRKQAAAELDAQADEQIWQALNHAAEGRETMAKVAVASAKDLLRQSVEAKCSAISAERRAANLEARP